MPVLDGLEATRRLRAMPEGSLAHAYLAFVESEFVRAKARNTAYHTAGNGWPDHARYAAAFPFVTGALRLEDVKGQTLLLQIANKSMLMDQKRGQRLADECMSPEQNLVAEAIKKNPIPSVLEPLPVAKQ